MRPALLRMAIRYLENSDEAEDAVQDALLKLWFLRDRLDQYRSVDALAIVITKHLCINRLRGTRIEKVDLEQGISIGGGENPEMKLVEEENMQEILELLSKKYPENTRINNLFMRTDCLRYQIRYTSF